MNAPVQIIPPYRHTPLFPTAERPALERGATSTPQQDAPEAGGDVPD